MPAVLNSSNDLNELIVILGPTASGKTKLAVDLAKRIDAEIISADSRQVYQSLNIGSGKDLEEYGEIPYHLIDIVHPSEQYSVFHFQEDFQRIFGNINSRGKKAILCGGTGFYIQAALKGFEWSAVPPNQKLRIELESENIESLRSLLATKTLPRDFKVDLKSKKRVIRAIEIANYNQEISQRVERKNCTLINSRVFGILLPVELRRQMITDRLNYRLKIGLWQEVENLSQSLSAEKLKWFGLEYKYLTEALNNPDRKDFYTKKLETEIHRFAKRQMTFFRKLEKDGFNIHWLDGAQNTVNMTNKILNMLSAGNNQNP